MILLILAVMLAGASIAVVGGISFLGLIAPHIAKTTRRTQKYTCHYHVRFNRRYTINAW